MEEFASPVPISISNSAHSNSAHSTTALHASGPDDVRLGDARELILRASDILKGMGPDYARVAWLLEDSLGMLHSEDFDSMVDFDAEYEVLTREFIPVVRAPGIVDRPRGKGSKKPRTARK